MTTAAVRVACRRWVALRFRGKAKELVLATEGLDFGCSSRAATHGHVTRGHVTHGHVTHVGPTATPIDEARRLQTQADAALRRGELGKAIKGYGAAMRALVSRPRQAGAVAVHSFIPTFQPSPLAPRSRATPLRFWGWGLRGVSLTTAALW